MDSTLQLLRVAMECGIALSVLYCHLRLTLGVLTFSWHIHMCMKWPISTVVPSSVSGRQELLVLVDTGSHWFDFEVMPSVCIIWHLTSDR